MTYLTTQYAKVIAYLATHSQTNTYQSPQNRWHSSSHLPPAQTSYRLPCWIVALRHYITWLSPQVRRFLWSKNTWCAPVGAGVALRSAPQLWRKSRGALLNATCLWAQLNATRPKQECIWITREIYVKSILYVVFTKDVTMEFLKISTTTTTLDLSSRLLCLVE